MSSLATMMARQRAARLAKEAIEAEDKAQEARQAHATSAPNFWDNIDTSGGPDACHPWTGRRKWNHSAAHPETPGSYEHGTFQYLGCDSWLSHRVLIFASYGRELPATLDVVPLCGDHLCHNLRHLVVARHGGSGANKLNTATPVEEYFRCEAA